MQIEIKQDGFGKWLIRREDEEGSTLLAMCDDFETAREVAETFKKHEKSN